tara:strand:+ start:355 stop:852 length:498 start_codon:yes stop_codon:yes gene_type:complete
MNKCSICLEEINNKSTTNCNHSFCFNCLNEWLSKNKNTCPICRTQLKHYINNGNNTKIISIFNTDIDPIHNQLIRELISRHAKLKCFLYFISIGFTYTLSRLLTTEYNNLSLIREINDCKYNLTQLENEIYYDDNNYNSVLVYDTNINKMSHCMISDYYYNKCFS